MDDSVILNAEPASAIEPITASADGKRNSFTLNCVPTGQSMNYAACLWRQGVLVTPNVKVPPDWNACNTARCGGECTALVMRKEEELAGKSIYFKDRNFIRKITDSARKWLMPKTTFSSSFAGKEVPAEPKVKRTSSMLDAMGDAGTFADAITEAAKTPASSPLVAAVSRPATPVALTGESPLAMARRLAIGRSNGIS